MTIVVLFGILLSNDYSFYANSGYLIGGNVFMKQYCILCNKSISLFGKIISDDRPEGKICFACSEKIKAILSLYDKMESCYTVDQLKIILSKYPTAKAYIDGLASEMKDYDDDVKEAEKSIKDLNSEIKKMIEILISENLNLKVK